MMIYTLLTFLILSILLITKNINKNNVLWYTSMLIGFSLAIIGLAFYEQYINSYTDDKLFGNISNIIWTLDYYFKVDNYKQYLLMNIGSAIYIYAAVCFPISYLNSHLMRVKAYMFLAIFPIVFFIAYAPVTISAIFELDSTVAASLINKNIINGYKYLDLIFNVISKLYLVSSVGVFMYIIKITIPRHRIKFIYMLIGIIPMHILYMVVFYWFPNHNIAYKRLYLYSDISAPYNKLLYGLIISFIILSSVIMVYAMWRYNIFEISVRTKKINFEKEMKIANVGLKVFNHTIKNHIIAIKILAEQIEKSDEQKRADMISQIINICDDSITKLSNSFAKTSRVELRYDYFNVCQIMREKVKDYSKLYPNAKLELESNSETILYIDKLQFEKVIDNLIMNAIEACSKLDKAYIHIKVQSTGSYTLIDIKDNGSGIETKI